MWGPRMTFLVVCMCTDAEHVKWCLPPWCVTRNFLDGHQPSLCECICTTFLGADLGVQIYGEARACHECSALWINFMSACRVSELFETRKQELQQQMSASYKAGCTSVTVARDTREMCATLQRQLTAALAA